MILSVFLALTGLGLVLWGIGHITDYTEIGAIGAVIVIAAGGMVALGGLQYQSGSVMDKAYSSFEQSDGNITAVNNETVVTDRYKDVSFPAQMQFGGLVMIVGGSLLARRFNETAKGG